MECKVTSVVLKRVMGTRFDMKRLGGLLAVAVSRQDFVENILRTYQNSIYDTPLTLLPKAGCLAAKFEAMDTAGNKYFSFPAVLDTGSPFLTAPPQVMPFTESTWLAATNEQYGDTKSELMEWRSVQRLRACNVLCRDFILGFPSRKLIEETGGIFCGLIAKDEFRPSFISQLPFPVESFSIDWRTQKLSFNTRMQTYSWGSTVEPLAAVNLCQFGGNLHHYAVKCSKMTVFELGGETKTFSHLSRDIVVVIDTGLTGCVFSDSWKEISFFNPMLISGVNLHLGNDSVTLQSDTKHFSPVCFELPWFNDNNHPHIVAAGATFFQNRRLTIDLRFEQVYIE